MTNSVTNNNYECRVRYHSHLIGVVIRHAEEPRLYLNLSPEGREQIRQRLTVTRATISRVLSVCDKTKCVRGCACVWVYLVGDLEVLRVEDSEALRELQQLPWRCELLLGVSPGDLTDDNDWTNTHHTHKHKHTYTYTKQCVCI